MTVTNPDSSHKKIRAS